MTFSGHTGYGLLFFLSQPDSGLNHSAGQFPLPGLGLNHSAEPSPLPAPGLNPGAGQSPLPQGEGQGEGEDDG